MLFTDADHLESDLMEEDEVCKQRDEVVEKECDNARDKPDRYCKSGNARHPELRITVAGSFVHFRLLIFCCFHTHSYALFAALFFARCPLVLISRGPLI